MYEYKHRLVGGNLKKNPKKNYVGWILAERPVGGSIKKKHGDFRISSNTFSLITKFIKMRPHPLPLYGGGGAHHTDDFRKRAWQHTLNPKP